MIDLKNRYITESLLKIVDTLNEVEPRTEEVKNELLSIYESLRYDKCTDDILNVLYKHGILYPNIELDMLKTCCFTGPRPDNLYGYNLSDERYEYLLEKIIFVCEQLITRKDVCNFIVGGAQGFDTLAYLAVRKLKEKYNNLKIILAVPCEKYNDLWPHDAKVLLNNMKKQADVFVEVDKVIEYNKNLSLIGIAKAYKYQVRNQFMVDKSKYVCSCYDGRTSGGTFNCVNYIRRVNSEVRRIVFNIDKELYNINRLDTGW